MKAHGLKRIIPIAQARAIIQHISEETNIPVAEIVGERRFPSVVQARFRAYHALRLAGCSYPSIGRLMQRDHSTVMHGVRRIEQAMAA